MKLPKLSRAMLASGLGAALAALAPIAPAQAFPWSIDMYRGPQVSTFTEAPREMPDGTLPIDGTHYNTHYGQPAGMPDQASLPPMKLEVMTVKMHNPLPPDPANLAQGQERFATNCAPCHGEKGLGDGPVVHLLHRKPANLLTGVSKNLPDGYIYGYIRNGGIAMPAYDDAMSSDERWQVVLYVRDLQRKYGAEAATAAATPPKNPAATTGEHRETTDSDPTYSEIGSDSP